MLKKLYFIIALAQLHNFAAASDCPDGSQRLDQALVECQFWIDYTEQRNIDWGITITFVDVGYGRSVLQCFSTRNEYGSSLRYVSDDFPTSCIDVDDPNIPTPPPPKIISNNNPNSCGRAGSIIFTSNQVLGEIIPLVGIPFYLTHFSDRVVGKIAEYKTVIPLSGPTISQKITGFEVVISDSQNNNISTNSLSAIVNQVLYYQWNGIENGVETWGAVKRNIDIKTFTNSTLVPDGHYTLLVGSLKAKKLGLGGWVPSIWHFYDSLAEKIYNGDGSFRKAKAIKDGIYDRVASADGSEVFYFDSIGRIALTKTGLIGATLFSFSYDQYSQKLLSISDSYNNVTRFTYDSNNNISQIISAENIKTNLSVDQNGYLKSVTNPKNESYIMTYMDAKGLLSSFQKPNGVKAFFTYDENGNLLTDVNSGGQSSTLIRTELGVNALSALGRLTQNNYDAVTNSEIEIRPSGLATTYVYAPDLESVSNVIRVTKSNLVNDPRFGEQVKNYSQTQTTNFGTTLLNIEDAVNLSDLTNPFAITSLSKTFTDGSSEYISQYDGLTRTNTITSKFGRFISTQLDALERTIMEQSGNTIPKKYKYQNELLTKINQGDREVLLSYNPSNKLLTSVKNSENQEINFYYDQAQRLSAKRLPDGRVVNFQYDSNNNLVSITPPGRPAHKLNYGATEQLSSYVPPSLQGVTNVSTQYTYSLDKELTKILRPDGKEINFNYNQVSGLLGTISGSFGVISREYQNELVTKITDQNNQIARLGYTGSVISSLEITDSNQNTVYRYQRDPSTSTSGSVGNESISSGNKNQSIAYGYDDDKFLTEAGYLNLSYNSPNGSLKETALQNIKEEYFYNNFGEVKGFRAFYVENNQKKLIYSYELKRDKIGRITNKIETFGKDEENRHRHKKHHHFCRHHRNEKKIETNYLYDKAGRLVRVKAEKRPDSVYLYDKNSNRIAGVATGSPFVALYDNQDRLIRFNNQIYSYNANGELLSKSERIRSSYINTNYSYDVFGGLKLAGNVTYQIDPLNRRSAKLVNNVVVKKYVYNPEGQLIGELNAQGELLKTFIYASKSHVPDYFIDQNNELFKLVVDQLGSVRLVVKASTGEVVQKMNHDEFGKVLEDSNPGFTPFGFAGGLYDSETKLVRFGARDYDSETGRWTSKDPIRFNGGDSNLYGYVMSDPVNFIDPSGLKTNGYGVSFSASGFGFSASASLGYVTDHTGNSGVLACGGVGASAGTTIMIPSASITMDSSYSNASTINSLGGPGFQSGGSVSGGLSVGGGLFGGNGYQGGTASVGIGTPGGSVNVMPTGSILFPLGR